jgi:hypothetical protein
LARERYAIKLSPGFNCFDYITPDEMGLSQIIADMLDPAAAHGQGTTFLRLFLDKLGLEEWPLEDVPDVRTEPPTVRGRRFDIEVRWANRILVIENKPWAGDQENQLHDYIADLVSRKPRVWQIVYLSGDGHPPPKESISANELETFTRAGNLKVIDYGTWLLEWLQACAAACQSERYRWFLGEFTTYVMAEFRGECDMVERQEVVKEIQKSVGNVQAAIEVSTAIVDVKRELLKELHAQLDAGAREMGLHMVCEFDLLQKYNGPGFLKFPEDQQPYGIGFSFESCSGNALIFGVYKAKKELPDNPEIAEVMRSAGLGLGIGKTTPWWPWYADAPRDIRNWVDNSVPWVGIKDGTLAKRLLGLVEKGYRAFEGEEKMAALRG